MPAVRPRTLSSWPSSSGSSTHCGLSAISNPTKNNELGGRELKKWYCSTSRLAPACRSLTLLWSAHRYCLREKRAHLVRVIMLKLSGEFRARGRRPQHLQAQVCSLASLCTECSCHRRSSVWRCCVEFFAAGACYDRRWHVVQHRLDWDGHTCCNLLPICIALITVCTA